MEKNIQKGRINNFVKYGSETITDHGTSYDYCSIMHYGPTAFSKVRCLLSNYYVIHFHAVSVDGYQYDFAGWSYVGN